MPSAEITNYPTQIVLKDSSEFDLNDLQLLHCGKVRDIYELDAERLILVATNRHSSFDRVLCEIPGKAEVLNLATKFWFEQTAGIVSNHALEYPNDQSIVAKRCKVLPIEVVVRGYITGSTKTSLWTNYQAGKRDFEDFVLADGLAKNQKLEEPVITPTTKSDAGDENLSCKEITEKEIIDPQLWQKIQTVALELFKRGQKIAAERGLILVDTKYEFGLDAGGNLTLVDELHTPDSSRFWQAASYQERLDKGLEPEAFDKELLRLWFKENCDPYNDVELPKAPEDMVAEMSRRYKQIYQQLTGEKL